MKPKQNNNSLLASVAKAFAAAFHQLFFTDSKRDFNRLKNFIAS